MVSVVEFVTEGLKLPDLWGVLVIAAAEVSESFFEFFLYYAVIVCSQLVLHLLNGMLFCKEITTSVVDKQPLVLFSSDFAMFKSVLIFIPQLHLLFKSFDVVPMVALRMAPFSFFYSFSYLLGL